MSVSIRHRVEYAVVAGVAALVGRLPHRVATAGGTALGVLYFCADRTRRRLALRNLASAFPRRSARARRTMAWQVFAHFGRLLIEVLRFGRMPPDRMRQLIEFDGAERVLAALAHGKGIILISGHFGFWELQGMAHGLELPPMAVVARRLDNPLLNDLLERARTQNGNAVIYRRGSVRRILRALADNQAVAFMIDQHIQTADAVTVDFFGRPASTTSAVAALALRTGAPVIPVFALPLEGGRYRLIYEHAVAPPASESDNAVREFTQRCTDVLEMYVRRHPHLWLWMHRRWRDGDTSEGRRSLAADRTQATDP